jgi:microcystin-dependent protein
MSDQYMGEIRLMSFNFPPKGWALCNGQFLPINQNQALFSLLGTNYGGNGQTTFALPNLRGRVPIHVGQGHTLGEAAGSTSVTINAQTMPQHLHFAQASASNANTAASQNTPANVLASGGGLYGKAKSLTSLHPSSVTNVGGSQAHDNMQPYLTLNFCIALQGIFPSQN